MAETLAGYMGGSYANINLVLRGLGGLEARRSKADRMADYAAMLSDVATMEGELKRFPVLPGGTPLYRRCGMYSHFRDLVTGLPYKVGDTFRDGGFLSSSRSLQYKRPQGMGQLVAVIMCSATSRGHDVMAVTGNGAEMEVLFERGSRFLIKKITALPESNVLWELTELSGT